ncbi:MAG: carboxypeptidase M32 [Phycisphaerales bacterium]
MPAHYSELCRLGREIGTLGAVAALGSWDQETYMPPAASDHRGEQQALLAGLIHERRTSSRVGELIGACESDRSLTGDSSSAPAASIREFRRDYDLATKLPRDLVEELARLGTQAQQAWKEARTKSDFALFAPWLEKMVALIRRKAECYGWKRDGEAYDALLDEYEPGGTAREVEGIFNPLRKRLAGLIGELASRGRAPSTACLNANILHDRQHAFGQFCLGAMGFDLKAGRLDTTTHPFCSGLAPGDTRLTTRYRDESFAGALYGTLHEMGHGLYEQGLPKADANAWGTPLAEAISLGIHESQSRMWENLVGRSREFWAWALPHAKKTLGGTLEAASVDDLYRAVNSSSPSLIRVEADETTYNLHIMLRFELERAIVKGDLKIRDIPAAWNARIKEYLGLDVPDDRRGCLQDVHWSFGAIGYFPTYALGNLYASQLWEKINTDIPDLKSRVSKGEFAPLLSWLREKIHRHGRRYRAGELCKIVTGKPLSADPFMRYIEGKIRPIYGV